MENFDILDIKLYDSCKKFNSNEIIKVFKENPEQIRIFNLNSYFDALNAIINKQGCFCNTSICEYDQDKLILAVRILYSIDSTEIVPGNDKNSKYEKGTNFWWTDWSNPNFSGYTLFFISDINFKSIEMLLPMKMAYDPMFLKSDVRLLKCKKTNRMFAYNPKYNLLALPFTIIHNKENNIYLISFNNNIKINNFNIINNGSYTSIEVSDEKSRSYFYLDWFYEKGIKYTSITSKLLVEDIFVKDKVAEKYYEIDNKHMIVGDGSFIGQIGKITDKHINYGITPLFSFGTPNIMYEKDGTKYFIGVGHTKIHTDNDLYKYKEGSNISLFRENLYKDFKEKFNDKYIRHDAYNSNVKIRKGYTYLMYFYYYKIDNNNTIIDFKVSDSYLPINLNHGYKYVFSLIFPMGRY